MPNEKKGDDPLYHLNLPFNRMATRYLYAQSGSIIGSMDHEGKQLYDQDGSVITSFNPPRQLRRASASRQKYMYRPDGSVYGYVSGVEKT
jgi:hypothetical protein